MRLTGATEDGRLEEAWAYLTPRELRDLYEALRVLLEDEDETEWHHHIGGPGGELTLAIEP